MGTALTVADVLGGLAVLLAVVILLDGWATRRQRRHHTATAIAAAARPLDIQAAIRAELDAAWGRLSNTCCLTAWASRGTQHDPVTCRVPRT